MIQLLNLAIGLSFVFLLLSLILSAVNEAWLSLLDQRTRFLREGLRELFQEHSHPALAGWVKAFGCKLIGKAPNAVEAAPAAAGAAGAANPPVSLLGEFYSHGLINSLSRGQDGRPAYIAADLFVTALIDIIRKKDAQGGNDAATQIRNGITAIRGLNAHFGQALEALFEKASGDVTQFEAALQNWFNMSMDRVTGWYKRYTQQWLIALGFLLAVSCNVDTLHIIKALSSDPKLLQGVVDQAVNFTKANPAPAAGSDSAQVKESLDALAKKATDTLTTLSATNIPMGWNATQVAYFSADVFTALLGWLLTAFAISLGAPFWFDMLNRFISIRGNGLSPDEIKARALARTDGH